MTEPKLDHNGWEVPDPNPVEVPAGFQRPESLAETIQRLIRSDVSRIADEEGLETFDEADDFEMEDDDDFDLETPYETIFDPILGREVTAAQLLEQRDEYKQLYDEALNKLRPHAEQISEERSDESEAENEVPPKGGPVGPEPKAEDE